MKPKPGSPLDRLSQFIKDFKDLRPHHRTLKVLTGKPPRYLTEKDLLDVAELTTQITSEEENDA